MRLKGKTAIITGATGGIGRCLVEGFIQEGCRVAVADIDQKAIKIFCDELNSKYGDVAVPIYMDVSDEASVNSAFDVCMQALHKIDILISNAGIQHLSPIIDFAYKDWQRVLKICLDGCFFTAKRAMEEMKKTGGGSILFMGSLRSKIGGRNNSAYVAAKHAILGFNRVLATEGADFNIRSNVLCPDYILTPLVEKQIVQLMEEHKMSRQEVITKIMLPETVDGQFTTVDDVKNVALFFASFPTNALTGQSLLISHGWGMG
ncbi:MAG: 3-hydroxybutyrate dehydrogenase [Chlamydiota bacterium]